MLLRVGLLISFIFSIIFVSCAPKQSQIVLAEFDNQKITKNEFKKAYAKNVGDMKQAEDDSLAQMKDFLKLYVDFRMKLEDAQNKGFASDSELNSELLDYKKKVGVTYILNKDIVDPGIKQLYERRKWEIRISHIMIRPDSTGWEGAKKTAQSILDSIKNGADFAKMAKEYSQDKYSAPDGGDLFYFTAGELPPQFEDVIYETQPGHVYPQLVKSDYGYHIIKVTGKIKRIPEIRASHILIRFTNEKGKTDTLAAYEKIDTVMQKLKAGTDFAELAKEYSEDPGSREHGGDLGFFSMRRMVKPFAEAAFSLKKVGDISGIVRSPYGYHIIKLTGIKSMPTFEADQDMLKRIFKETRYQAQYDSLVDSLKTAYNFKIVQATLDTLNAHDDSLIVGAEDQKLSPYDTMTVFSYDSKAEKVGDFLQRTNQQSTFSNRRMNPELLKNAVNKVGGDFVLDEAALGLDKVDTTFADLMKNYREGIYIFQLEQDEVWNKLQPDSAELYNYYEKHKQEYTWPNRVDFSEIFSRSDSAINVYYTKLQNGANFDTLASQYTERAGFKKTAGDWGLQDVDSSDITKKANMLSRPGEYTKPFKTEGGYSIVKLNEKDPARLKTFSEAKAEVSGAYQEMESKKLENDYLQSLDKEFQPKIYYDKLEEAFKAK
jgi:peptidyl-prolyl cis-trans isomerase SurA